MFFEALIYYKKAKIELEKELVAYKYEISCKYSAEMLKLYQPKQQDNGNNN